MSYVFKSDINIEYPFYKEMISKLSGSKSKSLFNGQEKGSHGIWKDSKYIHTCLSCRWL